MSNLEPAESPVERCPWEMSLGEFLDGAVKRNPEKVYVEISGQSFTYREIQQAANQTAGMFQAMGVGKGDRVCLFMPNCPEYLFCWFGLSVLGAIGVPVNTGYKRDEMAYILNDAGASALVAHESLVSTAHEAAGMAPSVQHRLVVKNAPGLAEDGENSPIPSGWASFTESLKSSQALAPLPLVSPHDVSMLVYTSGTTGNPKGVMVTHLMYVAAGQGFAH